MNIERALETPGFMAEIELEYLATLASTSKSIVEIGSWQGRSARAMADNTEGVIFCVDTWADNAYGSAPAEMTCHPEWLWNEFRKTHADTIASRKVLTQRSDSVVGAVMAAASGFVFDMIFIDAGHNYEDVVADINAWKPLLREGGIICGHDYAKYHPGVMKAVNEFIPKYRLVGTIWSTEGV